jgi:bifunctional non-homologous end joining protein LigD
VPPSKTDQLSSGSEWLHEIKHNGLRVIARKNAGQVNLYSRRSNDLTYRFPLIVETLARLHARSASSMERRLPVMMRGSLRSIRLRRDRSMVTISDAVP